MNVPDLPKPHCILVDGAGRRFVDEAQSYMANGQDFYAHGAVPAHAIMDASYFRKYSWGFRMGAVPKVWHDSGFLKSAPTLLEFASAPSNQVRMKAEEWSIPHQRFQKMKVKGIFLSINKRTK